MTYNPRVNRTQPLNEADLAQVDALTRKKRLTEWERGELRGLQLRADQTVSDAIRSRLASADTGDSHRQHAGQERRR